MIRLLVTPIKDSMQPAGGLRFCERFRGTPGLLQVTRALLTVSPSG